MGRGLQCVKQEYVLSARVVMLRGSKYTLMWEKFSKLWECS